MVVGDTRCKARLGRSFFLRYFVVGRQIERRVSLLNLYFSTVQIATPYRTKSILKDIIFARKPAAAFTEP